GWGNSRGGWPARVSRLATPVGRDGRLFQNRRQFLEFLDHFFQVLPEQRSIFGGGDALTRFASGGPGSGSRHRDADFIPGATDGLLLAAIGAVELAGDLVRDVGAVLELRGRPELAQGAVPDVAGVFPSVAAQLGGNEIESPVGDAGIDVDPTVVARFGVRKFHIVVHVAGLWVLAQAGVVVGSARLFHRAEGLAVN